MLKQFTTSTAVIIRGNASRTRFSQISNMDTLCQRVTALHLTPRFFNSTVQIKKELQQQSQQVQQTEQMVGSDKNSENFRKNLSPGELLRREALKIEAPANLRPRCAWLPEEDEKLLELVKAMGRSWTAISKHFVDRPPTVLLNRYHLLTDVKKYGPWTAKEVIALKELGKGRNPDEIDNWMEIQAKLPVERPLYLIKQKYHHTLNPVLKVGRWSEDESEKLARLVSKYGIKNMTQVAVLMGSRNKRQCLERWKWQMAAAKKGRFTQEEDVQILAAVSKYGENFAVVAKVTGSERLPRHISQHYRNLLAPDIDRSPWSMTEQAEVYDTLQKTNGDMLKVKEILGSRRAIRDLWNHARSQEKYIAGINSSSSSSSSSSRPVKEEK